MSILFWLDVAALSISVLTAASLSLTVMGSGPGRALNRSFALFSLLEATWAVSSLLLHLTLWLEIGNPLFLGELATWVIALMGPSLLMFTVHFLGRRTRRTDLAAILGLAVVAVLGVPLFRHQLVSNPRLGASGSTTLDLSAWGFVAAAVPVLYMVWALVLFWQERRRTREPWLTSSVLTLLLGFVVGGVLEIDFPVLSITNTLSIAILGYGIIGRQLLNPLRESEARYRAVVEDQTELISRFLPDGTLTFVNEAYCRYSGKKQKELLGQSSLPFIPEEDQRMVRKQHASLGPENPVVTYEHRIRRSDGEMRWLQRTDRGIFDEQGHIVEFQSVGQDVTEHKQAAEQVQQRTAQLEALQEIGLELTAQLDLDTLLGSIVSRAIELLGGTEGGMYLYRPDRDVLEWTMAIGPHMAPLGTTLRRGEGLSGKIWETGEPLIVGDYLHWEGRAAVYEGYPFVTTAGAPVRWGEELLGVVNVNSDIPHAFSPDDVELLAIFATHAAIAIRNARLYQETQQRALEQRTLREAALALTSALDLHEVINRILDQLREVVPYDTASVQLLRENHLEIVGGRGFPNLEELLGFCFPVDGDNPNREVVRTRAPFIVADAPTAYEGFRRQPHAPAGIRSWLGVPMLVGERLIGMIALDKSEPAFYTQEHVRLVEAYAAQAAIAIENARLHQEVLDHAEQLEQRVQERTAEIEAQYARLDAILRSTADGIVVTDAEGNIIEANPVVQAWLTQTLSLEEADRLQEAVRSLAERAAAQPTALLELAELDLELRATPILEPGLAEDASVVAIHDVSEFKALDRMKTRFITNISHELRTPITTIKLYAYLMQRHPERLAEYLAPLVQEADHQARLVEDVLQMSRMEAGQLQMRPRPIPLNDLTTNAVANYRVLAQERGLTLRHQLTELEPVALADPERIRQVLNHLVGNAILYTSEGGAVVVSTGREELKGQAWATITVADTGMGIPEEELPHIFERFFRGEEPRIMQAPGTGLGLSIAQEIVRLHGGRVTVESEKDAGSTFTVWLPLAE